MKDMTLTDLVDEYILQELQDLFVSKTNIIVMMVNADGRAVTQSRLHCKFCNDFTKKTEEGLRRCDYCDRLHAEEAFEKRKAICYTCHAGLCDFIAPIIINETMFGYVVGGQVTEKPLEKERVYALADELGIDRDAYWEAAKEVKLVTKERLDVASKLVFSLARMISDIADNKYNVLKASREIEEAAKMKSDFLANMSHEIRTPMNAVIGMADMALMEDLPANARKYISQIKRSGKTLLAIINDILDFSKIESGRMDITLAYYSTYKMIDDVAAIIATRLADKPVELIIDISGDVPGELMGDVVRIKQVIMNLAGNAAKFTNRGYVKIGVSSVKTSDNSYDLNVSVEDSGIGIKQSDLSKIFVSFQQIDSKRNRNIEGTGLGLTISEQLVKLMNGSLGVESEYGKGSRFYFTIPQITMNETERVHVEEAGSISSTVMVDNEYVKDQLFRDICALGIKCEVVGEIDMVKDIKSDYLFVDIDNYSDEVYRLAKERADMTVVVLAGMAEAFESELPNVMLIKKPIYMFTLAMLFNHQDVHVFGNGDDEEYVVSFTAPEAKVLVVDDNEVNIAVAKGLLEPLSMQVDTAVSGMEAVDMISAESYDLIFMDHMMPQMDGIETTRVIRRFHPEYDNVPIIALTANAMENSKSMFLVEGMNDFVAKPIEVQTLIEMVNKWLPDELKEPLTEQIVLGQHNKTNDVDELSVPGLDLKGALKIMGSRDVLWKALENYYRVIGKKSELIRKYVDEQDWKNYTIEVHALKSSSRQIGAEKLGIMAAALEDAGNKLRIEEIIHDTPTLLKEYGSIREVLGEHFPAEEEEGGLKGGIPAGLLSELLVQLENACEELDMEGMEKAVAALKEYSYTGEHKRMYDGVREAVEGLDVETCGKFICEWRNIIHI